MIGVLTYSVPHRKTYDTLCMMKALGYKNVKVFSKPFSYQKKYCPMIYHRPDVFCDITPDKLCSNLEYDYSKIESFDEINEPDNSIMLVCGAGLLPDTFISKYKVINSHPGYVPNCRGLDALKWAIYEDQPVGVTSHLVGDEIDAGYVIIRRIVPVYENDTFHRLAQRVYEEEIRVLVESIQHTNDELMYISGDETMVHKRMPHNIEAVMLKHFDEYKEKYVIKEK
ncbi:MAG: formyltransferase family protein [Oscillospiraceae bacterium]|nr:formyltransferase family protein [Oscillospiraceae bacterium]